jgi:hypothetical protein
VVEQSLLVARIAFVVLLYLFVWRVVRLSVRDVRAPQESIVLSAGAAAAVGLGAAMSRSARATPPGRLRVEESPVFPNGTLVLLDDDVVFGRAPECDVVLDGDGTVSARHARAGRRDDGVMVEDLGSTNGTFVNGERLAAARALRFGDVLVIGATRLVLEREAS